MKVETHTLNRGLFGASPLDIVRHSKQSSGLSIGTVCHRAKTQPHIFTDLDNDMIRFDDVI